MSTLYVNLYGGPGTGKSTTAAGLFAHLKLAGVNAEYVSEYAKRKVWERSLSVLEDQVYILGKQYHSLWCLQGQVDVVVTDSPLLLSLIYGAHEGEAFKQFVKHLHDRFRNLDVFLRRVKPFNPAGRTQDEEKARALDPQVRAVLDASGGYVEMDADKEAVTQLFELVYRTLNEPRDIPSVTKRVARGGVGTWGLSGNLFVLPDD